MLHKGDSSPLLDSIRLELDNLAAFMRGAVEYKKKIGFEGTLLLEPKPQARLQGPGRTSETDLSSCAPYTNGCMQLLVPLTLDAGLPGCGTSYYLLSSQLNAASAMPNLSLQHLLLAPCQEGRSPPCATLCQRRSLNRQLAWRPGADQAPVRLGRGHHHELPAHVRPGGRVQAQHRVQPRHAGGALLRSRAAGAGRILECMLVVCKATVTQELHGKFCTGHMLAAWCMSLPACCHAVTFAYQIDCNKRSSQVAFLPNIQMRLQLCALTLSTVLAPTGVFGVWDARKH